jgi:quercetin dioxygenase-like cupin family protein
MIRKSIAHTEMNDVTMEGVERTRIQWLFGPDDGAPTYYLRRFVMAPGGSIPLHGHDWEHEIYVLRGRAQVFTDEETLSVGPGDALYVPPDEPHGYRNDGDEDFEFLCVVPTKAAG